jgi:hypothetical protein
MDVSSGPQGEETRQRIRSREYYLDAFHVAIYACAKIDIVRDKGTMATDRKNPR